MIGGIGALDFNPVGRTAGAFEGAPAAPGAGPTQSFASVLSGLASDAVGTLRQAEQVSVQALQGEADTREVVDAVMNAEQALQAAVAIRDKIVSAYMEISRMAI